MMIERDYTLTVLCASKAHEGRRVLVAHITGDDVGDDATNWRVRVPRRRGPYGPDSHEVGLVDDRVIGLGSPDEPAWLRGEGGAIGEFPRNRYRLSCWRCENAQEPTEIVVNDHKLYRLAGGLRAAGITQVDLGALRAILSMKAKALG